MSLTAPILHEIETQRKQDVWIFTPNSFVNIVDKGDPSGQTLLVRARKTGDIERLFPGVEVQIGGGTDYRYRARVGREAVAQKIADEIRKIRFPNFKKEVRDAARHDAYLQVWRTMFDFQKQSVWPAAAI